MNLFWKAPNRPPATPFLAGAVLEWRSVPTLPLQLNQKYLEFYQPSSNKNPGATCSAAFSWDVPAVENSHFTVKPNLFYS